MLHWLRGLGGALLGGMLGYRAFFWILDQGFYALVLPGALLGLGCGYLSGMKSVALGSVCALLAMLLGIYTEWRSAPFVVDNSLVFFLTHLHELKPMTLIMIALGGFFGFRLGTGNQRNAAINEPSPM